MAWIFTTDGDYVNFNGGGNLWRLHKDSNCISWHWDETGDLFFDVYDQEYTVKAGNIADVIIDGTPLSAASGFPAAITAAFTGIGTQLVLSKTVTLTDAQIKALPTAYVEVIAAVPNKFINVIWASIVFDTSGGAYTGIGADNAILLGYADWESEATVITTLPSGAGILNSALPPAVRIDQRATWDSYLVNEEQTSVNTPIKIIGYNNGNADFTGGNEANTLKVTVYYVVVDL